ncbi:25540_t:CDS:1, partial [Gigaspora margarita]
MYNSGSEYSILDNKLKCSRLYNEDNKVKHSKLCNKNNSIGVTETQLE